MARNCRAPHRLLMAACFFALLARISVAAVVYVNINCPGPVHDGKSWATAFQSIREGIGWANAGDELWVAQGIYFGPYSGLADLALYGGFAGTESQRGQRDWTKFPAVLDGGGGYGIGGTVRAVLDGFTVRNGTSITFTVAPGNGTIANCLITGNDGGVSADGCALRNNVFVRNIGGVRVGDGGSLLGNVIAYNYGGWNVQYQGDSNAPGQRTIILNNTIVGNRSRGGSGDTSDTGNNAGGIILWAAGGQPLIANNIIAFNTGGIYQDGNATPVMQNNCVFGNGSDYDHITNPTGQDGNISVDPQLANWPAGDFHLSPGSPCINAGNTADVAAIPGFELDMDGQPRVMGSAVDIGADEAVVSGFTSYDARYAMRAALGGLRVTPLMADRMNVNAGSKVDLLDAVRLMRKVAGLEANP